MKLRPLADRVIVKQSDAEEKTKSGIVLPDSAKEKPTKGKIIAVQVSTIHEKFAKKMWGDVAEIKSYDTQDNANLDLANGRRVRWRRAGPRTAEARLDFARAERVGLVRLEEDIAGGQDVARYRVEGTDGRRWSLLSRGKTIGYRKVDRVEPVEVRGLRVVIEDAVAPPRSLRIGAYRG